MRGRACRCRCYALAKPRTRQLCKDTAYPKQYIVRDLLDTWRTSIARGAGEGGGGSLDSAKYAISSSFQEAEFAVYGRLPRLGTNRASEHYQRGKQE